MSINIERFFNEQIREQRKAGSGAFHRRGKGVKHGMRSALLTPFYFMKNKDKKKLNGEVMVYNMYETIIPKEEFFLKEEALQKTMLTRWREIFDNHTIRTQLGMTNKDFYDLVNELGIPKKNRVESMNKAREGKVKVKIEKTKEKKQNKNLLEKFEDAIGLPLTEAPPVEEAPKQEIALKEEPKNNYTQQAPEVFKPMLLTKGLHLEYNGDYTADQLTKIFTKLQVLTDGEENKFSLSISLSERL